MLQASVPATPDPGQDASGMGVEAQRILRLIARGRAAELAALGRHGEAEAMLEGVPMGPAVLDLLARIRAQQGRLGEAEALWREALQVEPGNAVSMAGIAEVRRRLGAKGAGSLWMPNLPWLSVLSLLAWLAFLLARRPGLPPRAPSIAPSAARPSNSASAGNFDLAIQAPRLEMKWEGREGVLEFTEAIFDGSARLSRAGASSLTLAGRQLEARGRGLAILVEGRSDGTPIPGGKSFRSNEELAMARAQAVYGHLLRTTRLPPSAFTLRARVVAQEVPGPPARTAVLRISRAEGKEP